MERLQREEMMKRQRKLVEQPHKKVLINKRKIMEDKSLISDGYHTFAELYEHRHTLYIALCRERLNLLKHYDEGQLDFYKPIWRSRFHSDGTHYNGWFLLGINQECGEQITYHLPDSKWNECSFAYILDKAPTFDGHTSEDVLNRIKNI